MLIAIERNIDEFPMQASKLFINRASILGFKFYRFEEAIEDIDKALSLNPDSEEANSLKEDLLKLQTEVKYSQLYV